MAARLSTIYLAFLSHSLFLRKLPQCGSTRGCMKVITILSQVWHQVTGPVSHGPHPTGPVTLRQTAPQNVNLFHAPPSTVSKAITSVQHEPGYKTKELLTRTDRDMFGSLTLNTYCIVLAGLCLVLC